MRALVFTVFFLISSLLYADVATAVCTNSVWNKIMDRGTVVVGVKSDDKPWGFRDSNGNIVGIEIDMAKQVADKLGVELELVPVKSTNRMVLLELGKIDMIIATMSDRADRRSIVGMVAPPYYSSGTNVLAPKVLKLKNWEDLTGKTICGKQGTFYNKIVTERYKVKVIPYERNAEAIQALRTRRCIAWLYDDVSIAARLTSGRLEEFEMPLESEDLNPWTLAVPHEERNCIFGQFMSGVIFNWHQSGELLKMHERWGMKSTTYLTEQNKRHSDWLTE